VIFFDIAKPMAEMGVPQIRVRHDSKAAFDKDWPSMATADLQLLKELSFTYPNSNSASVAQAKIGGIWIWEVDSADVIPRMERETGQTLPQTFKVRSRPGRGHLYFRQTPASIAMGNLSQTYVVGQDWSARVNNMYCVAPNSIHPDTLKPYEALNWGTPIAEAPDWLVAWLLSQKIQKQINTSSSSDGAPRDSNNKVPHGSIHGFLLHHAGRLRNVGLTQSEIEPALIRIAEEQCAPPIDFSKVIQMSKSICNFAPGEDKTLVLDQATVPSVQRLEPGEEPEEVPTFETIEYPVFPRHVMFGTSIYEGFVKPYCENSSRVDYFMWMPTAAMMMNYLGTKVSVPLVEWKPSFYLVLIGRKGRANKSSSIKDGMKFLEYAAVLSMYSKNIKNADGKSLVWEVGSPEGLGTDMMRTNCTNPILFYDELSSLVGKARIEGSGMNSTLLKMYESGHFANSIKTKKDTYNIAQDSYCATLITATTDKKFTEL